MYNPSFKPVLFGLGLGVVLFVLPFFLLKAALLLLVSGALFRLSRRLFGGRSLGARRAPWGMSWHPVHPHRVWTDTIRAMSDDEYQSFRQTLRPDQPGVARTTIQIQ